MEMGPMLTYVYSCLSKGNVWDVEILKRMIILMSGLDINETPTDHQIECLGCGDYLRNEVRSICCILLFQSHLVADSSFLPLGDA
jgi:hypothetical protein